MKIMNQIIIGAFVFSLVAGLWLIFELKTKYLNGVSAVSAGELKFEETPELSENINAFLEGQYPTCEHVLLATDDRYAYVDHVCGVFEKEGEKNIVQKQGPRGPARLEFNAQKQILAAVTLQEDQDQFIDQYRKLFPDAIQVINSKKTDRRFENLLPRAYARQQNRQNGT